MAPQALRAALIDAAQRLSAAGVPSPQVDARLIAAHLHGVGQLDLHGLTEVPVGFWEAIDRRAEREPLQHILGTAPFGPLDLAVGPGVFIPRPETEVLADWGVRQLASIRTPRVVDLCTGSGALALYVAAACPAADVAGVDKQVVALDYARRNAEGTGVDMLLGDVTDPETLAEWHGTVDLVLTNPPYVPVTDDLEPEVYVDPPEAVFAGPMGMDVISGMVELIHRLLCPGAAVGIEHDDSTSAEVQAVLRDHGGFDQISVLHDLTGRARFVTASKLSD